MFQTFEGVQKCKKSETLAAIMERIVKAEVGHRHGEEPNWVKLFVWYKKWKISNAEYVFYQHIITLKLFYAN